LPEASERNHENPRFHAGKTAKIKAVPLNAYRYFRLAGIQFVSALATRGNNAKCHLCSAKKRLDGRKIRMLSDTQPAITSLHLVLQAFID